MENGKQQNERMYYLENIFCIIYQQFIYEIVNEVSLQIKWYSIGNGHSSWMIGMTSHARREFLVPKLQLVECKGSKYITKCQDTEIEKKEIRTTHEGHFTSFSNNLTNLRAKHGESSENPETFSFLSPLLEIPREIQRRLFVDMHHWRDDVAPAEKGACFYRRGRALAFESRRLGKLQLARARIFQSRHF
mgnify:CR=1 FL=1